MEIRDLILEGKSLAGISEKEELQCKYDLWCSKVKASVRKAGFCNKNQEEIKIKMHYTENEYSEIDTLKSLKKSLYSVIQILEEELVFPKKDIDRQAELKLIEKILDNFYMYYRAMYRQPVHKKGTLKTEILNAVQIVHVKV